MVTMQDAIKLAKFAFNIVGNSTGYMQLEAELRDAHHGQGNGGKFEDWLQAMADDDNGTLQFAAVEFIGLQRLMEEAHRFMVKAGEEL
jgi:hypothetical protein